LVSSSSTLYSLTPDPNGRRVDESKSLEVFPYIDNLR
jgi:hypothetical protein